MEFNKLNETRYGILSAGELLGYVDCEDDKWWFKYSYGVEWDLDLDDMKRITNFMESLEREEASKNQLASILEHMQKD